MVLRGTALALMLPLPSPVTPSVGSSCHRQPLSIDLERGLDLNLFPARLLKNLLHSLDPVIMGCPGDLVILCVPGDLLTTRGSRFAAPLISAGWPSSESRRPGDEKKGEQSLSDYPVSTAEAGLTRLVLLPAREGWSQRQSCWEKRPGASALLTPLYPLGRVVDMTGSPLAPPIPVLWLTAKAGTLSWACACDLAHTHPSVAFEILPSRAPVGVCPSPMPSPCVCSPTPRVSLFCRFSKGASKPYLLSTGL